MTRPPNGLGLKKILFNISIENLNKNSKMLITHGQGAL